MKMKLLTEVSQRVKVGDGTDGNLFIEGIFSTAENKNINGRIYKKSILEREVDKLMEKVENKCLWGELGHNSQPDINPERISHLIEKIEWQGNDLVGKAKIIDTPMGNIAKTLVKEGRIGISSRGLGTVNETNNYVNEDFFLIGWDLVLDPSNQPSWINAISEGREFDVPWITSKNDTPEQKITIEEARKAYHKKIWQVLETIEKSL
jgi:hypothetical protein